MTDYSEMNTQLAAVTEGVDELISNLSNAAAVLWTNFDRINWAGFYIMRDNRLILGPFHGKDFHMDFTYDENGNLISQSYDNSTSSTRKYEFMYSPYELNEMFNEITYYDIMEIDY